MGKRVLITRPEPGASRTAARLREFGHDPVLLPLTGTRPLSAELPDGLAFDAVAISSANALRHADAALLRRFNGIQAFAVGERTAEAATQSGLASPTTGPGDGAGLATLIARRFPPGSRIAYLCGRVRISGFEAALKVAGISVIPVETYDTARLHVSDDEAQAATRRPPDAVLIYSRVAAEAFLELTDRSVISSAVARSAILCMSGRVADPLSRLAAGRVKIAASPSEDAMLALLDE